MLHNGDQEKAVVSYNPDLFETMHAAQLKDKPIKMKNFYEKLDEFQGKPVVTLGEQSVVEYSDVSIPFSKVQNHLKIVNSFNNLKEIAENVCINDTVNVIGHVSLTNSDIQEIQTKFGVKRKRDIQLHDDNYSMKLTLWNNQIDLIPKNGNYKFKDLRVKCYNGKYLTTTSMTVVAPAPNVTFQEKEPVEVAPEEFISFPAVTIDQYSESFSCKRCTHKSIPKGSFIICTNCGSKSLRNSNESLLFIKASFKRDDNSLISLVIPHNVFISFLQKINENPSNDADKIQEKMMTLDNFKVSYKPKTKTVTDIVEI